MTDAESNPRGYVYILAPKGMVLPVCKIGRTARDPRLRLAEINRGSTGDFLWAVAHSIAVDDCHAFESIVHAQLAPLRQTGREFFNIHADQALGTEVPIGDDCGADLRDAMDRLQPVYDWVRAVAGDAS